jgi:hypothetical protein
MNDRSSRPHNSPRRLATRCERRIIAMRVNRRWGPARIGYLLGLHPLTVHRVLSRYGLAKLIIDRHAVEAQGYLDSQNILEALEPTAR